MHPLKSHENGLKFIFQCKTSSLVPRQICVIYVTRPLIAQATAINSISLCPTGIAMPAVHIHLTFFSELFWNSMKTGKIMKHLSTATCDTAQKYRTATFSLTVRRLALTRNNNTPNSGRCGSGNATICKWGQLNAPPPATTDSSKSQLWGKLCLVLSKINKRTGPIALWVTEHAHLNFDLLRACRHLLCLTELCTITLRSLQNVLPRGAYCAPCINIFLWDREFCCGWLWRKHSWLQKDILTDAKPHQMYRMENIFLIFSCACI